MLDYDIQEKFILLRAENKSYSQITKALGISKDSCIKLNRELATRIAEVKADNLQRLYSAYNATKEARIKKLGSSLKKLENAINETDLRLVPPEKLLELQLKYIQALKEEYAPPADQVELQELKPSDIYNLFIGLLNRVRQGEITEVQAQRELYIISRLQRSYENVELNDKVEALRIIIDDNGQGLMASGG